MARNSVLRVGFFGLASLLALAPAARAGGPYQFSSVAPCRVVDTRNPTGPNGGPALASDTTRSFPIVGLCGVPSTARAVTLNVTVVTPTHFGFLTIWPNGITMPLVSTLNFTGTEGAVANGAIVPLGTDGSAQLSVQAGMGAPGAAHLILDVTGYFQ